MKTGIEMSLVIPNFATDFDIADLVKCFSMRKTLLVSATNDIYSKDATDIVNKVRHELKAENEIDCLEHKQYSGSHALTQERFEFMIDWVKSHAVK